MAKEDCISATEHAEERPCAAATRGRALDQAWDLDQLHEHAANPSQRRHRPRRRERVGAGLDLDVGQRLEQRRLAGVRWPDERDLRGTLPPDGDRVAVGYAFLHPRVLELRLDPLADVGVRAVLVPRQLGEDRA